MGAGMELGGHSRINLDHDLLFVSHKSVPYFLLLAHPVPEIISDHGGADVDDPLSGDLW